MCVKNKRASLLCCKRFYSERLPWMLRIEWATSDRLKMTILSKKNISVDSEVITYTRSVTFGMTTIWNDDIWHCDILE